MHGYWALHEGCLQLRGEAGVRDRPRLHFALAGELGIDQRVEQLGRHGSRRGALAGRQRPERRRGPVPLVERGLELEGQPEQDLLPGRRPDQLYGQRQAVVIQAEAEAEAARTYAASFGSLDPHTTPRAQDDIVNKAIQRTLYNWDSKDGKLVLALRERPDGWQGGGVSTRDKFTQQQGYPLNSHGKADARNSRPAKLGNKPIVTATGCHSRL